MAVYDREFGISFPRIRPKLESWDLRKSHDDKLLTHLWDEPQVFVKVVFSKVNTSN